MVSSCIIEFPLLLYLMSEATNSPAMENNNSSEEINFDSYLSSKVYCFVNYKKNKI